MTDAEVDPLLVATSLLTGIEPMKPIDTERALRLVLAVLEDDTEALILTLADTVSDKRGVKQIDAVVSTLTQLAAHLAKAHEMTIGRDQAIQALREDIISSLRGEDG